MRGAIRWNSLAVVRRSSTSVGVNWGGHGVTYRIYKEPELAFEEATAVTFAASCQLVMPGRAS